MDGCGAGWSSTDGDATDDAAAINGSAGNCRGGCAEDTLSTEAAAAVAGAAAAVLLA